MKNLLIILGLVWCSTNAGTFDTGMLWLNELPDSLYNRTQTIRGRAYIITAHDKEIETFRKYIVIWPSYSGCEKSISNQGGK